MNVDATSPPLSLEVAKLSDVGRKRPSNQDALTTRLVEEQETWQGRGHLLMVADGMGAHAAGELASKLAAEHVPQSYYASTDMAPPAALRHAVREANRVIHTKGQNSLDFQGMGTTCTCLVLMPLGAFVAHVGDSRAYRLRRHTFEQLTFDHSLIWETAATGQLSEDNLLAVIPKNVITRSLGPHEIVNVDLEGPHEVLPGDTFLVCSDGLTGQVADEELGTIIGQMGPDEAVQTLVDLANLRGGTDNISVIVARVAGEPPDVENGEGVSPVNRRTDSPRHVKSGIWLAAAASMTLLIAAGYARSWLGMSLGAAGLGACAAAVILRRLTPVEQSAIHAISGPYGNGPYRQFDCRPGRGVVDSLARIAGQLKEMTGLDDWPDELDWAPIDELNKRAAEAANANDFATSIKGYCEAIRLTMRQVREHSATVTTQTGFQLE